MMLHFRYDIMMSCWRDLPSDRPTFTDLLHLLDKLLMTVMAQVISKLAYYFIVI